MPIEPFQRHGEHVFLNGENAKEIVQKALDHMEYQHKSIARTAAFEDCTEYWKKELEKIEITDYTAEEKWDAVKRLFRIKDFAFAQSATKATEQPNEVVAEEKVYGNDCKDDSCS